MTKTKITHALALPAKVSSMTTYCGMPVREAKSHDYMATIPEAVDCPNCIRAMRRAREILEEWVPKLKEVGDG